MKKIFIGLFIVSLVFFAGCKFNSEKSRVKTIGVKYVGSIVMDSIEMKILILDGNYAASDYGEAGLRSDIWFFYPAEQVPENINGKKIELIYRLNKVSPFILEVIHIKILN